MPSLTRDVVSLLVRDAARAIGDEFNHLGTANESRIRQELIFRQIALFEAG
jgi:hypothetical protein